MENSSPLKRLSQFLRRPVSRKKFLQIGLGGLGFLAAQNYFAKFVYAKAEESSGRPQKNIKGEHDLVVVSGPDPYQNTVKAVEAMGGMKRFVRKGATVVVKPNMAWDRNPQQAANTEPAVVAAVVDMCFQAGAKRVNVFDIPCNDERRSQENSGIKAAAEARGAKVYLANHWNIVKAKFPYESQMNGWPVLRDAVSCDTFINVPVLKDHGLTGLTMSMKNLMGVCSGVRGMIHLDIGEKLVDLADFIKPELTIVDATRFLARHGPSGGNLEDVVVMNRVLAGTDLTLIDTYAAVMVKRDPRDIPNIRAAVGRGFGQGDITQADIQILEA